MNVEEIQNVLSQMAELIGVGGSLDWAIVLEKFAFEIGHEPGFVSAKILSTFGGIGSLNDIVLYNDGQPLGGENEELDILRTRLYQLCHE